MEMPKHSWLVRTTAVDPRPPLDAESIAILMKYQKECEEAEEARWKPIMEQVYIKDREWRLANKDMIEAKEAAWEKLIKDGKVFKDMNAKDGSKDSKDGSKDDKDDA